MTVVLSVSAADFDRLWRMSRRDREREVARLVDVRGVRRVIIAEVL
jgi:hypothetical protein